MNVAVDPEIPLWSVPYDAETLSPTVIAEAHRSHPVIIDAVSYQGSAHYAGRAHADLMFAAELPDLAGPSVATAFSAHNVGRLVTWRLPAPHPLPLRRALRDLEVRLRLVA